MVAEAILVRLGQALALLEWVRIEDPVLPQIIKGLLLRDPLGGALSRILPKKIMPVSFHNLKSCLPNLIPFVLPFVVYNVIA